MSVNFVDRVSTYPNRYKVTREDGTTEYLTLERADEPTVVGTPLNATTFNDAFGNINPDLTGYATETYVNDAVKVAAPRNLADNSDFTQFIAQAGIGGTHEVDEYYAGDRWILDSGTVTGEERNDDNGYTNITLNGTIRQKVANPPNVGTAAIEMTSGTAVISYENGEITITSSGGVIKNVRLFDGNYTADNMPEYQPKGYSAELLECMRYFIANVGSGYGVTTSNFVNVNVPVGQVMRKSPSITNINLQTVRCNGKIITPTGLSFSSRRGNAVVIKVSYADGAADGNNLFALWIGSCDLSADL